MDASTDRTIEIENWYSVGRVDRVGVWKRSERRALTSGGWRGRRFVLCINRRIIIISRRVGCTVGTVVPVDTCNVRIVTPLYHRVVWSFAIIGGRTNEPCPADAGRFEAPVVLHDYVMGSDLDHAGRPEPAQSITIYGDVVTYREAGRKRACGASSVACNARVAVCDLVLLSGEASSHRFEGLGMVVVGTVARKPRTSLNRS